MITVDSLTKKYRKNTAVDDISFVAPAGRVTGFLGPNGAGHGLVGIGERVKIYGGEMTAGASRGGGFLLRVRLPQDDGGDG
jgi:ABC-type uncharacterized transport system ATPase subunit